MKNFLCIGSPGSPVTALMLKLVSKKILGSMRNKFPKIVSTLKGKICTNTDTFEEANIHRSYQVKLTTFFFCMFTGKV